MANPFYIPRRRSPLLDYAQLGMQLYGLKQRADIAKGQTETAQQTLTLKERQLKGEEAERKVRYGTEGQPGLEQQKLAAGKRLTDIKEREVGVKERGIPVTDQDFGMDKVAMFEGALAKTGMDKAFAGIIEPMKSMAKDEKYNNREVYLHFKKNWPAYRDAAIEGLSKELTKMETDAMTANPYKAEQIRQVIEQLSQDKEGMIIDQAMPSTAQAIADEQTALQAKIKLTPETPEAKLTRAKDLATHKETLKRQTEALTPEKPLTPTEKRQTAKDVAGAEEIILTNPDKEAVRGQIDLFNQYANKPYCYLWTEGKPKGAWKKGIEFVIGTSFAEGELGKIKLPPIKGKQVYAKDVWDTAQQHGITYEEVLKRIGAIK